MFNFAKEYFVENNFLNLVLWCLKGNFPSIEFYKAMGGKIFDTRKAIVNNIELEEVGLEYNLNDSIFLRDFKESDAKEIIKWIGNECSFRLWSADRYPSYPITAKDINDNYNECINNGDFYPKTLVSDNKIIGHLILRRPSKDTSIIRLGFIIVNPAMRGKGYGKILIEKAIEYARNELHAKKITLGVFHVNSSAYNCYKSVGFIETSIEKDAFRFNNEIWNCIEMVLVK